MYELFLIITFIVIFLIPRLKIAQSINFMCVIVIYFNNELNLIDEPNLFKWGIMFSMVTTSLVLIMNARYFEV